MILTQVNYRSLKINIFLIILVFASCQNDKQSSSAKITREDMLNVNKYLVVKDKELIDSYIKKNKIDSILQNGAGLYYKIWGITKGTKVTKNSIVEFKYKVTLLDGTVCYTSENDGLKVFRVGSGGVESGLEQAVQLMCEGQSGFFIMPPHLAYGVAGDNNKIPPRAIIIYEIEMLTIQH